MIDHFIRAKATLEEADLSEELFPIKYLKAILKRAPVFIYCLLKHLYPG